MSDEPPDPLARLGERIDKARAERVQREPSAVDRSTMQQGLGLGLRIGIELVVAIGIATGLGWALDRWFGTRPWGMVVLFFLGVAAGMLKSQLGCAGGSLTNVGKAGGQTPADAVKALGGLFGKKKN